MGWLIHTALIFMSEVSHLFRPQTLTVSLFSSILCYFVTYSHIVLLFLYCSILSLSVSSS